MTLRELVNIWEKTPTSPLADTEMTIKLGVKEAAKISALAEMYPSRTREQILTELVSAALNELEYKLPYVQGSKIASRDEMGDPIYEDIGPTTKFTELTKKHLEQPKQH